jgi:hypothetical protein
MRVTLGVAATIHGVTKTEPRRPRMKEPTMDEPEFKAWSEQFREALETSARELDNGGRAAR